MRDFLVEFLDECIDLAAEGNKIGSEWKSTEIFLGLFLFDLHHLKDDIHYTCSHHEIRMIEVFHCLEYYRECTTFLGIIIGTLL